MSRLLAFALLTLSFAFFAYAQSSTSSSSSANSASASTSSGSPSASASSNNNVQPSSIVTVITTTVVFQGVSVSGSQSITTNHTLVETLTTTIAAPTTQASPLPTASLPSDAGGGIDGAPVPGQAGVNGAYGPGDNYIAGASQLRTNALIVTLLSIILGAFMVAA